MITGWDWVILALFAALVAQDTTAGPQLLFSEPLVAGTVAGLILGDLRLGLLVGTAIQLIWCGAVPAGTAVFLDINVGTVCAVAVARSAGGAPIAAAASVLWLIPVGLLGCALTEIGMRFCGTLVASIRPERVTASALVLRHAAGWLFAGARGSVTFLAGAGAGVAAVPVLVRLLGAAVDPGVLWAGLFGAGAGSAIAATWRFSKGKAAFLGAAGVLGAWAGGLLPVSW